MPRTSRQFAGGQVYHVLNRSNAHFRMFARDEDYAAFLQILADAVHKCRNRLLAYCLMPNHWHLVVYPVEDNELARFVGWLSLTHAQRWRHAHNTVGFGSLYQGRYRCFPIQDDSHFLTVCRYVERNALRAKLCDAAQEWPWSSAAQRQSPATSTTRPVLSDWPVDRPANWLRLLNTAQTSKELDEIRQSVRRSRPFGDPVWQASVARKLGLESTLRKPGRPALKG